MASRVGTGHNMTTWAGQQAQYSYHDMVLQRLAGMPSFVVYTLDDSGNPIPWQVMSAQTLLAELVITPHNLQAQIDVVGAQIAFWGRLVALAQRVVSVGERNYRVWRSGKELDAYENGIELVGTDPATGAPTKATKKVTKAEVESYVRGLPEYLPLQVAIETFTETALACQAVYEGFRAKRDVLRSDTWHSSDGMVHRRSL
jgi:hypothetical protein